MKMEIERRFTPGRVELRSEDGKPAVMRGTAAVFNVRSENFGSEQQPFFEEIAPGAFDEVLKDDVRALFNHDANLILARSKGGAGTLRLSVDSTGLVYEAELPDTSYARDLKVSLDRGDVDQSSFAFTVAGHKYEERHENGKTVRIRTITKIARLYDVSPVTYPAYPYATVALRCAGESLKPADEQGTNFPYRRWAAGIGL